MPMIEAVKPVEYGQKTYKPGVKFDATKDHARALVALGKAKYPDGQAEEAKVAKAKAPAKSKAAEKDKKGQA